MSKNFILTTKEDLEAGVKAAVKQAIAEFENEKKSNHIYYVNQVAKLLGKSHATIKKLCKNGLIKTTADGLITHDAIQEYLGKK